ncbi:hypothetical protein ACFQRC_05385 [Enterovirga sp. GCM10030262]|uniref:hypothetical protein n=1 Tax=Enterovirga sp. GCM10030262 TaxID=3273391 RepID=UPI003619994C
MTDLSNAFAAPFLKLERAKHHLAELEASLVEFFATPVPISRFEPWQNADGTWGMEIASEPHDPPPMTATILGDIIHNLRSSLDLMACALALQRGESPDGVHFPFAGEEDDLDLMIRKRRFNLCGEDAVRLLKTLRPYKGGNLELRAIHDLDIIDKHRSLVPKPDAMFHVEFPQLGEQPDGRLILGKPYIANRGTPSLTAPDDWGVGSRPVVETLKDLVELCESILKAFVALKASPE